MADISPMVFIVDDDYGVRDSLKLLLRSVGLDSEAHENAWEFLCSFDPTRPGCIVLDVRMPGMSGMELQKELINRGSVTPILFISAHGDIPMAVEAIKGGASDFIQKPFRDQDLLDKIHHALEEDARFRAEVSDREVIRSRMESLSPREVEVMDLVVQGLSNKAIARSLGISQRTVEVHRARVMAKMEAPSVPHLVRMTLQAGSDPSPR